jgi:photosystem II stability/assembly factor-like uncharacterized protein
MKQKFFFLILAIIAASISSNAQWTIVNQKGGPYVFSMILEDSTLIAGTQKGMEISTDGGRSWVKQINSLEKNPIYSLHLDGGGVLYIGTTTGGYISKDYGKTLVPLKFNAAGRSENTVEVYDFFTSGSQIVCATNIGAYVSHNAGATWLKSGKEFDNNSILEFTYFKNTLFAAVFGEGVFASTDYGDTWTHTPLAEGHVTHLINDGKNIYTGTAGSGLFISNDKGKTWKKARDIRDDQYIYSFLAADGYLYAGTATGVLVSSNQGANWTEEPMGKNGVYSLVIKGSTLFAGTKGDGLWQRKALKKESGHQKNKK